MGAGWFVERVDDYGQRLDDGLVGGDFAVEDAERVGDGAALAVGAHLADNWNEGGAQGFVVAGAVGGGADGVEFEGPAGDAELVEQGGEHFQDFGVAEGAFAAGGWRADDFGADLRELAVAAFLRALAAELGADVKELLELAGFAEPVLDVGADYAGGVFGAEGEGLGFFGLRAGAVFPGVHLLGDDVGFFADAAGEEGGVFEDGGADFAEVVAGEDVAGGGLDAVPEGGFRRQQVARAADGFQGGHGLFSLNGRRTVRRMTFGLRVMIRAENPKVLKCAHKVRNVCS